MRNHGRRRIVAAFFLLIFSLELLLPTVSYALTSGPAQPEMQKFEPAGASDLVDLFSGDMKYNIPLLDVGGYPINLSYQSGTSMDEEASWVGTGWTLNPGALNRNLRGLPDEFDGTKGDFIQKEYSKKEFKKVGGQIVLKPTLFAWEQAKLGATFKLNVYKDNYYGIGASVGAGLGFSLGENLKTPLTIGLGLDVNSDTREGVDFSPSLSISKQMDFSRDVYGSVGLSGGFTYNSRAGLKDVSLSGSFSTTAQYKNSNDDLMTSTIGTTATRYFGQSHTPAIMHKTSNTGFTFSFDLGPSVFAAYLGAGGAGYTYKEKILEPKAIVPAFGYLNYLKGRENENALIDFNREKDGVFLTSSPSIPIPVATNDFWMATGQTGSQQFRPHFGGNYIVFDRMHNNLSSNTTLGITIGAGNLYQVGGRADLTNGEAISGKWVANNLYLNKGEADFDNLDPDDEPVYFKQVGERTVADMGFYQEFGGTDVKKVVINDRQHQSSNAKSFESFKDRVGVTAIPAQIKKEERESRIYPFSYLTAQQATKYALDKKINDESRILNHRKDHHFSEVTITDNEGKRMVYGIPVYNITQEEVSFSVARPGNYEVAKRTGLITYSANDASRANNKGRDNLFSKEITPAYPTSFLLTGILSPDYQDMTGDGISDDDLGTAVKFRYSKLQSAFKWRAPFASMTANYNEGFDSDPKDDKASYVYGEKEIWYLDTVKSKTMIAIFEKSDREDGLGVLGSNGGMNTGVRLKKLDRIKLYSLADFIKNGSGAVPIKVVHFEYDYSLYPEVTNNTGNPVNKMGATVPLNDPANVNFAKGKLTLKKVYFTFGTSTRGEFNPYDFEYDLRPISSATIPNLPIPVSSDDDFKDRYFERQSDRWGTYKKSFYNNIGNSNNRLFNNSEFPYSIQEDENTSYSDRELSDLFASKWQLTKITTPTGGIISIEYESDDYAFVQNKRAMQMCFVKGIQTINQFYGLPASNKIVVELPRAVSNVTEFKNLYLKGADGAFMDKMFYKMNVDLDFQSHYEYVYGYAQLDMAQTSISGDGKTAYIGVKKIGGYNPVARAAWQMLRTDLPQYAYDNYDNSDVGDGIAAIKSIVTAIGNLRELTQPFESRAINRNYASRFNPAKSMVRLYNPSQRKLGGGSRVKKVEISDQWNEMTGISGSATSKYGQLYEYSIKDENGDFLSSSGVAAYEPQIGNEENPFHEPVSFTETVHWSSDRYHYIEKPYCESYFPAANVGYSKVTVTSFGNDYASGGPLVKHTGHIENEFYTARDFPTIVDNLTLDQTNYENSLVLRLFSATSINRVATSQGFKIELNDMHGKPKAVRVYNKAGDPISTSEYFYEVKDQNAQFKELENEVDVLQPDGTIQPKTIGMDVEFITDVRESRNESIGTSIGGYLGGFIIPFVFPLYIPYAGINYNESVTRNTYNSISAVKVINKYSILRKTRTMQNGSTIEAENLLWDPQTGEVLLTRTQTEHDKNIYSFSYPAHMVTAYEGMGAAYKNLGVLVDMSIGANGNIGAYSNYLFPGDELISLNYNVRGWVMKVGTNPISLIDKHGRPISQNDTYQVVRSGRRNHLTASAGSIISMYDPRANNTLSIDAGKKILDAKAVVFRDLWKVPIDKVYYDSTLFCHYDPDLTLNPYYRGLLGNWKPYTNHVYAVNRSQPPGDPNQQGGTDIRNSGYYSSFNPFWQFTTNGLANTIPEGEDVPANDNRWVWTNKPLHFDQKGNVLESVDALGRYSAALYGYQQSLPIAIGSNCGKNEMFFDGFEDYNFDLQNKGDSCRQRSVDFGFQWNQNQWESLSGFITDENAHTGKYSYSFDQELFIGTSFTIPDPLEPQWPEFFENGDGWVRTHFLGQWPRFRPHLNKKYLLSFWVYDGSASTNTVQGLQVTINGVAIPVSSMVVPVVEGWKRLEIPVEPYVSPSGWYVQFTPSSTLLMDDIRLLPYDGQLNSYVYDESTLRLSAQLDENNFATFYEYDEEGTPIRVKKETERGIMTLKENRQTYRRR